MEKLVKIFKALGDRNRLRIVKMLQRRSLCVCEITAILSLATPTVSKHLSILKEAGIIKDLKNGRWVEYSLNKDKMSPYLMGLFPLLSYWLEDDEQIKLDAERIKTVNREKLCSN